MHKTCNYDFIFFYSTITMVCIFPFFCFSVKVLNFFSNLSYFLLFDRTFFFVILQWSFFFDVVKQSSFFYIIFLFSYQVVVLKVFILTHHTLSLVLLILFECTSFFLYQNTLTIILYLLYLLTTISCNFSFHLFDCCYCLCLLLLLLFLCYVLFSFWIFGEPNVVHALRECCYCHWR